MIADAPPDSIASISFGFNFGLPYIAPPGRDENNTACELGFALLAVVVEVCAVGATFVALCVPSFHVGSRDRLPLNLIKGVCALWLSPSAAIFGVCCAAVRV
jgi:hypothetical protein